MTVPNRLAAAAIVSLALAVPLEAGQVKLEIRNGLVTLDAKDASVREILAEWSRVGQTRILNGDRLPASAPLTLQLVDIPESKALDILLRSVAGYVAAPRAQFVAAASRYDRIAVMAIARPSAAAPSAATGATPAGPAQGSTSGFERRGRMGGYPPQPPATVAGDEDEEEAANHQPPNAPGTAGAGRQMAPGFVSPAQMGVVGTPRGSGTAFPNPYGITAQPLTPQTPSTTTPGVATQGATRPGMVTAAPPKPPGAPDRQ